MCRSTRMVTCPVGSLSSVETCRVGTLSSRKLVECCRCPTGVGILSSAETCRVLQACRQRSGAAGVGASAARRWLYLAAGWGTRSACRLGALPHHAQRPRYDELWRTHCLPRRGEGGRGGWVAYLAGGPARSPAPCAPGWCGSTVGPAVNVFS